MHLTSNSLVMDASTLSLLKRNKGLIKHRMFTGSHRDTAHWFLNCHLQTNAAIRCRHLGNI